MNTNIAIIRDKLDVYGKPFVQKELLLKILEKFAPNYSINDLCTKWLLIPIKRGKRYINNKSKKFINPFVVGDLYMRDDIYMFGWISIYNKYGLSEQIAERHTIYNTKYSWKKIIGKCKFIFVRQRENFFYDIVQEKVDEYEYKSMSKERAFIQLLKENKQFTTIPFMINKDKLQKIAKKYTNQSLYTQIQQLCL